MLIYFNELLKYIGTMNCTCPSSRAVHSIMIPKNFKNHGDLAQMVERSVCIRQVGGSMPSISIFALICCNSLFGFVNLLSPKARRALTY